jgi:hypothetical protein
MSPDPWDAALSAIRASVDDLGAWLAIWSARTEPDAHARRCASDAVDAIDAALIELHGIRAELVGQIRRADDQAAARADALLARTRDGPRGRRSPGAISNRASNPPRPKTSAAAIVSRDGHSGRAPEA